MKKTTAFFLTLGLVVPLFFLNPPSARADRFWSGVAIGVGSAIVLGHIFHPPRVAYPDFRPIRVYNHPSRFSPPPPPAYGQKWIPGHWAQSYDRYGHWHRYWVPEHWERVY